MKIDWRIPEKYRNLLLRYNTLHGRYGNYVFQTSNGGQQIKLYEPQKYRNWRNTPQRTRARLIMHLATNDPNPSLQEKLKEPART